MVQKKRAAKPAKNAKRPEVAAPAVDPPPAKPMTVAQLAAAVGLSARALASCFERGCPRDSIESIEAWRAENITQPKKADSESSSLVRLKKRKLREQNRLLKIKGDQLESKMILRADAERVIRDLCVALKNDLEKLPDAIEMDIPRQHRSTLKRAFAHRINQALQRLSTWTI